MNPPTNDIQLRCTCNVCNGGIEFEAGHVGETVTCPHCGMDTVLFAPAGRPTPAVSESVPSIPRKPIQVVRRGIHRERINEIREASCYPVLRALIFTVSTLAYGTAGFIGLAGFVTAFATNNPMPGVDPATTAAGLVISAVIVSIVTAAAHEAAVVAVDIADILIADSAERRL